MYLCNSKFGRELQHRKSLAAVFNNFSLKSTASSSTHIQILLNNMNFIKNVVSINDILHHYEQMNNILHQ